MVARNEEFSPWTCVQLGEPEYRVVILILQQKGCHVSRGSASDGWDRRVPTSHPGSGAARRQLHLSLTTVK